MYNKNGFKRIIYFAASVAVMAVLVVLAVVLIRNSGSLTISGVKELFSQIKRSNPTDEFFFDSDNGAVFADLNGSFLAASTSGVQLFDDEGEEIFSETLLLSDPAVSSAGEYAAVYDISGTYLSVFDSKGKIWSIISENEIISASVDINGRLALCTDESGYRGSVTVYNSSGTALYKWYSASGFVLDAEMINKTEFIVLSLTQNGSCLTKLSIESEQEEGSVLIEGDMAIDFCVMSSGKICAVSDNGVYLADIDSAEYELKYSYDGRYLDKYAFGDDYIVMSLLNYRVGSAGQIISLNELGVRG